ncbi:hypothetical protein [Actinoallomurus soli]|uniref:hypothetical protein n=1 Tax=Actinoallomurus soli TaxID=2952535 RepID=UPI00209272E2|nr:hypothetical protein [Actinoallomurus soli]MCO5973849.1 hypothetical protein [Actinoallomurus soli]
MIVRRAAAVGAVAALAAGMVAASPAGAAPVERRPSRHVPDFTKHPVADGPARRTVPLGASRMRAAGAVSVTIDVLDRHGDAPATADDSSVTFAPLAGGDWIGADLADGHTAGEIPAGDYAVMTWVQTHEADGVTSTALVYRPRVSVTSSTRVLLDAREAVPINAVVDRTDSRVLDGVLSIGQRIGTETVDPIALVDVVHGYVTPTVAEPGLVVRAHAMLTQGGVEKGSPWLYNVAAIDRDRVPQDPGVRARTKDLAAVRTTYGVPQGSGCASKYVGAAWTGFGTFFPESVGAVPATRTEYFTPGIPWEMDTGFTGADCSFAPDDTEAWTRVETFPRAGAYERAWNVGPFGFGRFDSAPARVIWGTGGDDAEPALAVSVLATSTAGGPLAPVTGMTGTSVLRDADGKVVATSDQPGTAHGWPAPKPGRYTLTIDATRKAPRSDLSTRQHAVWTLAVKNADPLALPTISYDTPLDLRSRARAGAEQPVTVKADGATRRLTLDVSYDDGRSWQTLPVEKSGTAWTATVHNPTTGYVSFRATADGVEQTLIRAYGIKS